MHTFLAALAGLLCGLVLLVVCVCLVNGLYYRDLLFLSRKRTRGRETPDAEAGVEAWSRSSVGATSRPRSAASRRGHPRPATRPLGGRSPTAGGEDAKELLEDAKALAEDSPAGDEMHDRLEHWTWQHARTYIGEHLGHGGHDHGDAGDHDSGDHDGGGPDD